MYNKFLYKCMIMAIGVSLLPIILFILPIEKKYQYTYVKNACSLKSNFIYHRIFEDDTPIDIAFLGSSHTICAVNDSIIQQRITSKGYPINISNFGFCRLGRNLEYAIFKDLLLYKKPKMLLLEVRQDEFGVGHPDFGYIADINDILAPIPVLNRTYFTDLLHAYMIRLSYNRELLFGLKNNAVYEAPHLYFMQQNIIADTAILYKAANERWKRYYNNKNSEWLNNISSGFSKYYIHKIVKLAELNNIKIIFVYIPNYGYPYHKPKELYYYKQIADVLIMPNNFYDDTKNWMDDEHLNRNASVLLSDSIANYIAANHLNLFPH